MQRTQATTTLGLLVVTLALLAAGCGSSGDGTDGNPDDAGGGSSATPSPPATSGDPESVKDLVDGATSCGPWTETDPFGDSLATTEYLCGPENGGQEVAFLFVYDSSGSLQTDLAQEPTTVTQNANAVAVGDNWIFYTYSKSDLAAVLDLGATLHRGVDPGYSLP